jgi:hypothetical protein
MSVDGTFQAHIAFTPEAVSKWSSPMMIPIDPSWFGGRSQGNYVPLKTSIEAAVKIALEAKHNYYVAVTAATEQTKWYILTLTLNKDELFQTWSTCVLHWVTNASTNIKAMDFQDQGAEIRKPCECQRFGCLNFYILMCLYTRISPVFLSTQTRLSCDVHVTKALL